MAEPITSSMDGDSAAKASAATGKRDKALKAFRMSISDGVLSGTWFLCVWSGLVSV
jgi:hypothetical protein